MDNNNGFAYLSEKKALFLSSIDKGMDITQVSKKANISRAWANHITKDLISKGLIDYEKRGRHNYLMLTRKGEELKVMLINISSRVME